ncbi:hypothetical protein CBL_04287 [Carabus blaptoides fortunei]
MCHRRRELMNQERGTVGGAHHGNGGGMWVRAMLLCKISGIKSDCYDHNGIRGSVLRKALIVSLVHYEDDIVATARRRLSAAPGGCLLRVIGLSVLYSNGARNLGHPHHSTAEYIAAHTDQYETSEQKPVATGRKAMTAQSITIDDIQSSCIHNDITPSSYTSNARHPFFKIHCRYTAASIAIRGGGTFQTET